MVALALGFFCRWRGILYSEKTSLEGMFNFKYPRPPCGDYPAFLYGDSSDNICLS